ncbi:MAG: SDR family oxidoreductase [Myxococcales bacterium]|nr:SDR family oxidoreductase [Myxococcales bacterium]
MSRGGREDLGERVAVVTGGASGIGRALVAQLMRRRARVAVLDASREGCERLREHGVVACQVDVREPQQVHDAAARIGKEMGPVDLLFNNAGVAAIGPALSVPEADMRWVIDVNLLGAITVTQSFVPTMIGRRTRVAFTCSLAGLLAAPTMAVYSASKFGLRGYAQALRGELRQSGPSITIVYPGYVPTGLHEATRYHGAGVRELIGALPQRLAASPEQVATKILAATLAGQRELTLGPERLFVWLQRLSPAGFERTANALLGVVESRLGGAPAV